ncbi:hypothetical protein B0H11DRAFT_2398627 [Mycena galericulata]|nr:hypothetical protein B0H11DRAFT_2398627 [Mycena galericulata]
MSFFTVYRSASVIIKATANQFNRCAVNAMRVWFLLHQTFAAADIGYCGDGGGDSAGPSLGLGAGSGEKYVPPSMRGPGDTRTAGPPGGVGSARDDLPTLQVAKISEDTQESNLRELFSTFGHVARVYVGQDRGTGVGKGFAFVSFEERAVVQKAMEEVNGKPTPRCPLPAPHARALHTLPTIRSPTATLVRAAPPHHLDSLVSRFFFTLPHDALASFSANDVILLAAYASRTENQDAIDASVPFNPMDKRTKITYREESTGKLKRVTKGMTGSIIELCSRNRTEELEAKLE